MEWILVSAPGAIKPAEPSALFSQRQQSLMDIEALKIYARVAELASFTQAAEHLEPPRILRRLLRLRMEPS